jgi:hypothetical protein
MHGGYDYDPRDYGYEPGEQPDRSEFSDTQPGEPVIDYSIWPPEALYPEEARDESLRRLGRLTWRAALLSAVGAAAFAVLFVRSAPAHTTATSQNVVRPAGTLTPTATATPTPTPSPRHRRHKARGKGAEVAAPTPTPGAAPAPSVTAPSTPTLAPPTTPPAPSPSPSPAQSTSSGSPSPG